MKKEYFSEIVFTKEFYICGIDIFNMGNLTFIKNVDIDLRLNLSFSKLIGAKLYLIKNTKIKIAIAKVRDFHIICYMNNYFYKLHKYGNVTESHNKNGLLLKDYVIEKLRHLNEENVIYSDDCITRAVIEDNNGVISVQYQSLEIIDELDFYFYEDVNANNFWHWEDYPGISYFKTIEEAKENAKIDLKVKNWIKSNI